MKRSEAREKLRTVIGQVAEYLLQKAERMTYAPTVQGYLDDITRDFMDATDGDLLVSECRRRHKGYIQRDAPEAYAEGLQAGGVDPSDMDDEDRYAIEKWKLEQLAYVENLWNDIQKLIYDFDNGMITQAQYRDQKRAMYERLGTWGQALNDLMGQGKASALKNMMVTWQFGDTDHCDTCQSLNGKRHRLKWFTSRGYYPQQPGSDTLDCKGFKCQCTLQGDDGTVILPA